MPIGLSITALVLLALFACRRSMLCWSRSTVTDLCCTLLSLTGITAVLLVPAFSAGSSLLVDSAIQAIAKLPHFQIPIRTGYTAIDAAIAYLIFSLLQYWNHRALHSRWLWPIHRFHHSATEFSPLVSLRLHPLELAISPLFTFWLFFFFGFSPQVAFILTITHRLVGFLSHAEQDWLWGWFGSWILMAPGHHWIHHSTEAEHFNRNYGVLPVWDHLFGTWYGGEKRNKRIGLSEPIHNQRFFMLEWLEDASDLIRTRKPKSASVPQMN